MRERLRFEPVDLIPALIIGGGYLFLAVCWFWSTARSRFAPTTRISRDERTISGDSGAPDQPSRSEALTFK